eukprot:g10656.t1
MFKGRQIELAIPGWRDLTPAQLRIEIQLRSVRFMESSVHVHCVQDGFLFEPEICVIDKTEQPVNFTSHFECNTRTDKITISVGGHNQEHQMQRIQCAHSRLPGWRFTFLPGELDSPLKTMRRILFDPEKHAVQVYPGKMIPTGAVLTREILEDEYLSVLIRMDDGYRVRHERTPAGTLRFTQTWREEPVISKEELMGAKKGKKQSGSQLAISGSGPESEMLSVIQKMGALNLREPSRAVKVSPVEFGCSTRLGPRSGADVQVRFLERKEDENAASGKQFQSDVESLVKDMARAREQRDLAKVKLLLKQAEDAFGAKNEAGDNLVTGNSRKRLSDAIKKTRAAAETNPGPPAGADSKQANSAPKSKASHAPQLPLTSRRIQSEFTTKDASALIFLADRSALSRMFDTQASPLLDIANFKACVRAVASAGAGTTATGDSGSNHVSTKQARLGLYQALFLLCLHEQCGADSFFLKPPFSAQHIDACLQRYVCALVAQLLPDRVDSGETFVMKSAHPIDPLRDDEVWRLCFFWDRARQERIKPESKNTFTVDTSGPPVLRFIILSDEKSAAYQRLTLASEIKFPGLASDRVVWVKAADTELVPQTALSAPQSLLDDPFTSVERGSFLAFRIEDTHTVVKNTLIRHGKTPALLQHASDAQLLPIIDEHLQGQQNHAVHVGLKLGLVDPEVTAREKERVLQKYLQYYKQRKKLATIAMCYGENHPYFAYSRAALNPVLDDQEVISLLEKSQFGDQSSPENTDYERAEGCIVFAPPPPTTWSECGFDAAFWSSGRSGSSDESPSDALAVTALLAMQDLKEELGLESPAEELDAALVDVLQELADGAESGGSEISRPKSKSMHDEDTAGLRSIATAILPWLTDPAVRAEQRRRAEEVMAVYRAKGFRRRKSYAEVPWKKADTEDAKTKKLFPEPEPSSTVTAADGRRRAELKKQVREALQPLVKKHNSYRKVLAGMNLLRRIGLLDSDANHTKRSVTVRGSHVTVHDRNGCTTFVKDHRKTAPLSDKQYLAKMEQLVEAGPAGA